jgi:hypothetical protein
VVVALAAAAGTIATAGCVPTPPASVTGAGDLAIAGYGQASTNGVSATSTTVTIDEYGSDANRISGKREAVCRPQREGRVELIMVLSEQFPAVKSRLGYSCREIAGGGNGCYGRVAPASSTCWSTHAAGRAIDVMVGGGLNRPTSDGIVLGNRIADWLLATRRGEAHWYVRKMGIQQILWNDRCWDAQRKSDRNVTSAAGMRRCGISNHDNHVHLTLSDKGADGLTSWFLELGAGYGAG